MNGWLCRKHFSRYSLLLCQYGRKDIHLNRNFATLRRGNRKYWTLPLLKLGAIVTAIFARKIYLKSKEKTEYDVLEKHKDAFCKGSSGTLVKHGSYWLPEDFFPDQRALENIQNFRIRDDDALIASFPKSGTTWAQEITFLISNELNFQASKASTIEERFPYIEYVYPGLKALSKVEGARYMKTHLPYEYLPEDVKNGAGKLICIARNPKDVAVSYYYFVKLISFVKYTGEFQDFFGTFMDGKVPYGPWDKHVLSYWKRRNSTNVLFITYEDLHKSPKATLLKIAHFLGKSLTDKQIEALMLHCCFTNMKRNPMVNYSWWSDMGLVGDEKNAGEFMRKGKIGDWKNHFTEEMNVEIESSLISSLEAEGLKMVDS